MEWSETNPALRTGRLIKKKDDSEEELSELAPFTWEEKARQEETLQKHYPPHYPLFLTALRTGLRLG